MLPSPAAHLLRRQRPRPAFFSQQLRWARANSSRGKFPLKLMSSSGGEPKSQWWALDGEMHEIGVNVPPRERFVIPRDNLPNKRRKEMREQFMRRTRLVLKETEHEPWCKRYMELYQELRENWERLYWDEGYSKKIAQDHANYESAEDDDLDFSPYRRRRSHADQIKDNNFGGNKQANTWDKIGQIRDKFEYDREKRMREKGEMALNLVIRVLGCSHLISRNSSQVPRENKTLCVIQMKSLDRAPHHELQLNQNQFHHWRII